MLSLRSGAAVCGRIVRKLLIGSSRDHASNPSFPVFNPACWCDYSSCASLPTEFSCTARVRSVLDFIGAVVCLVREEVVPTWGVAVVWKMLGIFLLEVRPLSCKIEKVYYLCL